MDNASYKMALSLSFDYFNFTMIYIGALNTFFNAGVNQVVGITIFFCQFIITLSINIPTQLIGGIAKIKKQLGYQFIFGVC